MGKVRVVVADDSALMRRELRRLIESEGDIEVVGSARNGEEAVRMAAELEPDVVTLDINMPVMDGLTALQHIMMASPRPVIMVSSLTQEGAITSYEAMELGAVDFIGKPGGTVSSDLDSSTQELLYKLRSASCANLSVAGAARRRKKQQAKAIVRASSTGAQAPQVQGFGIADKLVLIGQSTGGPNTIMEVLPSIPAGFGAPIVIVQHMPGSFTGSFAQRLGKNCAIPFKEVKSGDELLPGHGYLAPGDVHTILVRDPKEPKRVFLRTSKLPSDTLHKPSVDVTFESALECFNARSLVGVILTGMGSDGARAMARIKQAGGRTIAESEETAVVFGMPKEAIRLGGAEFILPAHEVGKKICELAEK